ncbi:unnamed protein product, partial [Haemonchus placei]|uniref:Peptidase_M14 domain-containing protein n=1 Tax=Haemonchus placei TaxID=6290 RepID=A0A0N4VWY1_HAEPC
GGGGGGGRDPQIVYCFRTFDFHHFRGFYSIRFNITFSNKGDVCYFAYHFPYTFSFLQVGSFLRLGIFKSVTLLRVPTFSLGGNNVNLLTVTARCSAAEISKKRIVFLSSRVHPGESNASWMMHGILEALLTSVDPLIEELRERFVFKLVPMLNPDGVINGSHRCSLSGVDLNRYHFWNITNEITFEALLGRISESNERAFIRKKASCA